MPTKDIIAGSVYKESNVLFLELYKALVGKQKQASSYSINFQEKDDRISATIDTTRHSLGKLDNHIDETAGIAIDDSESHIELVVYTKNNKILRYAQSP